MTAFRRTCACRITRCPPYRFVIPTEKAVSWLPTNFLRKCMDCVNFKARTFGICC